MQLNQMHRASTSNADYVFELFEQEDTLRQIVGNYLLEDAVYNNRDPILSIWEELLNAGESKEGLLELVHGIFDEITDELVEYISLFPLHRAAV